ncbi:hypothetical protein EUX98_g2954 [Antrodiella citrinella]|uniref:Uncharacterized protein n=1 Tax=Antrodiella citrinella TaxID=2447956 RepID=A0A4S4N0M3_9APHY|nr:hypothetical protein EUX98_g2954 [Antrodiella citrinella]
MSTNSTESNGGDNDATADIASIDHGPSASEVLPPLTQFGRTNVDGTVDVLSVDWTQVALLEPENVAQWMFYLHRNQHPQTIRLLHTLAPGYTHPGDIMPPNITPQWYVYEESGLPGILMDIVSEPDMYCLESGSFKNVAYSLEILTLLSSFVLHIASPSGTEIMVAHIVQNVMDKHDRLCEALWNHRRLMHVLPESYTFRSPYLVLPGTYGRLSSFMVAVFQQFALMKELWGGSVYPFSSYGIKVHLYTWTYFPTGDYWRALTDHHVAVMANPKGPSVVGDVMTSAPHPFPEDLIKRLCLVLRDERVEGEDVYAAVSLTLRIVEFAPEVVAQVHAPLLSKLILISLLCCQRQMCRSQHDRQVCPSKYGVKLLTLSDLTHAIVLLLRLDGRPEQSHHPMAQESYLSKQLNITAIYSVTLTLAQYEEEEGTLDFGLTEFATRAHACTRVAAVGEHMRDNTIMLWHETLDTILAALTYDEEKLIRMKTKAHNAWLAYGKVFGLTADIRETTPPAKQPSRPSDESRPAPDAGL